MFKALLIPEMMSFGIVPTLQQSLVVAIDAPLYVAWLCE
jgi:hypothetical protein